MNIDVVRENVILPPLNTGDHVVVHYVGAYNFTQSMQFITLRPAVVMIDLNDKPNLIRTKESLDAVSRYEIVPEHLKEFEI